MNKSVRGNTSFESILSRGLWSAVEFLRLGEHGGDCCGRTTLSFSTRPGSPSFPPPPPPPPFPPTSTPYSPSQPQMYSRFSAQLTLRVNVNMTGSDKTLS